MTNKDRQEQKRIEKSFERARLLKDLEVAKELEVRDSLEKNVYRQNRKKETPVPRSDLPKE